MKLFLFAIGGTGARVVRSLTMMLAAGVKGLDSSTEIVPIIIDYDLSNGDKERAIKALEQYASIHSALYPDAVKGTKYDDHFFMTNIIPLSHAGVANTQDLRKDFEFNFGPTGSSIKFAKYLQKNAMQTNPSIQLTDQLLDALYDNSSSNNKDAELELDMSKGFKGNPNIGSVVFHSLREMPEFKAFENVFDSTNDRVFIVSSIFGGTGASGFPEIVNAIRSSNNAKVCNAIIGSAVVLPYFGLQPNNNPGNTGAIDANSFNAKTRAALGYYASPGGLNSLVNGIYYIGDENHDAYAYSEGESSQQNDAHVVEFVAATSIIDFMNRTGYILDSALKGSITDTSHDAFEFEIKDEKRTENIQLPDFESSTHTLVLNDLSVFAMAMKFYRDVVCGDRNQVSSSVAFYSDNRFKMSSTLTKGVYGLLDEFLLSKAKWGFYAWLDELKNHAHKLYPYQMDKSKNMKDILQHKTIKVTGTNPMRDDVLAGDINKASANLAIYNEMTFMKVLRDVMKKKYENVK